MSQLLGKELTEELLNHLKGEDISSKKGKAREIRESMAEVPFMSLFRVEIEQVLEDQEPDAMITSGVTFSRPEKKEINDLVEKVFQGVLTEPLTRL